jgi:hypothetical protein
MPMGMKLSDSKSAGYVAASASRGSAAARGLAWTHLAERVIASRVSLFVSGTRRGMRCTHSVGASMAFV